MHSLVGMFRSSGASSCLWPRAVLSATPASCRVTWRHWVEPRVRLRQLFDLNPRFRFISGCLVCSILTASVTSLSSGVPWHWATFIWYWWQGGLEKSDWWISCTCWTSTESSSLLSSPFKCSFPLTNAFLPASPIYMYSHPSLVH